MTRYQVSLEPNIQVGWDPATCEFYGEARIAGALHDTRLCRASDLASVYFWVRTLGERIDVDTTEALLLDRRHSLEAVEAAA